MDHRNLFNWRLMRCTLGVVTALTLFVILKPTLPASYAQPQPQPTPITFGTPVSYTVGQFPQDFEAADFNGDGKLDLVNANAGSSTVSLLLNRGDGTFNAKTDFPTGFSPFALTTGDFNNDGKRDVATANLTGGPSTVSLLLGNGNGGLAAKTDYPVGAAAIEVKSGDFNRDGKLDLVVGYTATTAVPAGQKFVTLLLNTTTGTGGSVSFGTRRDVPVGGIPDEILVADFNQDQILDLVTGNFTPQTFSLLLGNGDGTFAAARNTAPPNLVPLLLDAADNDGDGKLDLLVSGIGNALIYPGNGNGTFGAPVIIVIPAAAAPDANHRAPKKSVATRPTWAAHLAAPLVGKPGAQFVNCRQTSGQQGKDLLSSTGQNIFQYHLWLERHIFGSPFRIPVQEFVGIFDSYDLTGTGRCSLVYTSSDTNKITVVTTELAQTPKIPTTLTVTTNPNPSFIGDQVVVNYSVAPATATGQVKITVGDDAQSRFLPAPSGSFTRSFSQTSSFRFLNDEMSGR
jgi:hypothetical protein